MLNNNSITNICSLSNNHQQHNAFSTIRDRRIRKRKTSTFKVKHEFVVENGDIKDVYDDNANDDHDEVEEEEEDHEELEEEDEEELQLTIEEGDENSQDENSLVHQNRQFHNHHHNIHQSNEDSAEMEIKLEPDIQLVHDADKVEFDENVSGEFHILNLV